MVFEGERDQKILLPKTQLSRFSMKLQSFQTQNRQNFLVSAGLSAGQKNLTSDRRSPPPSPYVR